MTWQAVALDARDNVAVVLRPVAAAETIVVGASGTATEVLTVESIPLCHKVALDDIPAGAPILRYGQSIGAARIAIRRGAWVHVHNLVSLRARPTANAMIEADVDAYIAAASAVVGLPVPPERRLEVRANLTRLAAWFAVLTAPAVDEAAPDRRQQP